MKRTLFALGAILALALLVAPAVATAPLHTVTFSGHGTTVSGLEPEDEYVWDADVAFAGSAVQDADGTWHGRGIFRVLPRTVYRLDIQDATIGEFDEGCGVHLRGTAQADTAGHRTTFPFYLSLHQGPDGYQSFQFVRPMGPPDMGWMYSHYYLGYGMDAFNGGSLRIT